ncbi:hypothetical protein [Burkholderia anthina]|uniref:hypothetical protein n=1 Tax=Burkholderia anthina TaxID=179879 RepID=UPI0037C0C610
MANMFNVRVELLNGATAKDYDDLHVRMRAAGFNTVIVANDRSIWHLPPAEYVHVSDGNARGVRDRIAIIVKGGLRFGLAYRTYVVQVVDWASENLVAAR